MTLKKSHTSTSRRSILLMLVLFGAISICGCSSNNSAEKIEYLDRAFDFSSAFEKSENNQEYYLSTKLDSLFDIENGRYLLPDINGTSFKYYSVIVVTSLTKNNNLLLFVDKNDILRDTLTLPFKETFSVNVELSENKTGVCIGEYNEEFNRMTINDIYVLDNSIKLSKASNKTTIVRCPLPQDYLTEENPNLEETFSYRTDPSSAFKTNNGWIGVYRLELNLVRDMTITNWKCSVQIEDNNISVHHQFDNGAETIENLIIKSNSPNELVLVSPIDESSDYILTLEGNNFYLSGKYIYLMNPPNEKYEVLKESK